MDKYTPLLLFFVILVVSSVFTIQPANAVTGEWVAKASMTTSRCYLGSGSVNGIVYAIGGITYIPERYPGHKSTTTNVNEAYNPETDTWLEKTPMPSPNWLDSYGIAVWQNKIYCIGGPANNVYEPSTDTWEAKAPMPTPRHHLTANVVDGKIYLIGGLALGPTPEWQAKLTRDPNLLLVTHSLSNVNEMYDPSTDSWTQKAPMPVAVSAYASAVADNKVYIFSGRNDGNLVDLVQVYDTVNDEWSQATPIPRPVENAAAGAITIGKTRVISIVGGYFDGEYNGTTQNQVYFPENNSWTMGEPLIANMFALSVTVLDNKLYAIGGMGDGEYLASTYEYTPFDSPETSSTSSPPHSLSNGAINNFAFSPELAAGVILLSATVGILAVAVVLCLRKRGTPGGIVVKNP